MRATDAPKVCRRYADELRTEAGWALRRSAPQQKHLAVALGADKSRVSRECNGRDGRVSRFYEAVRALVRDGKTDAGHVIAGAMLVAEEEALRLDPGEIRRRLLDALAQETHAQAAEDVASHRLVVALGENARDLRAALEEYDQAVRAETARHVDALIYSRALMVVRGWRAGPRRVS